MLDLGLERDDVIISPFARLLWQFASEGSNIISFFCGKSSTTVLTGLWWPYAFIRPYQGSEILVTRGGSRILFFWKEMKVYMVSFLCGPLSLRIKLKITAVFCDQKVVFVAQERLSSLALIHTRYLTYIDLKRVFDWFVSKKHPRTRLELGTPLKYHDANMMHQT